MEMLARRIASSLGIDYRPVNEGVSMKLPAIQRRDLRTDPTGFFGKSPLAALRVSHVRRVRESGRLGAHWRSRLSAAAEVVAHRVIAAGGGNRTA
jgi:hypothetical protein